MSPPSRYFCAAGGEDGNENAAAAKKRGGTSPRGALQEFIMVADTQMKFGTEIVIVPPGGREVTDLPFANDWGWMSPKGFFFARPKAKHRGGEPDHLWPIFKDELKLPIIGQAESYFEGASQVTVLSEDRAIVGYGVRGDKTSCAEVAKVSGMKVHGLMSEAPFIHADTYLKLLRSKIPVLLFCPSALARADDGGWDPKAARKEVGRLCVEESIELVEISRQDGCGYATNLTEEEGGRLFSQAGVSFAVKKRLKKFGYSFHTYPLPCFYGDCGGAGCCLRNNITGALTLGWRPPEKYLYKSWREKLVRWLESYPIHEI